jgi:hypothetical protein
MRKWGGTERKVKAMAIPVFCCGAVIVEGSTKAQGISPRLFRTFGFST